MLRRAVRQVCSVNDGKGGDARWETVRRCKPSADGAEKKWTMLLSNAAPSAPLLSLVLALRREAFLACARVARSHAHPTRSYFFCLHPFTHVAQTFVLHVIRGEDLCAKPSPPRQVDRVSGSSRAVIPFFLAAMPYFARVFEEKQAVFKSRPR